MYCTDKELQIVEILKMSAGTWEANEIKIGSHKWGGEIILMGRDQI
jgi:hypothetical protein